MSAPSSRRASASNPKGSPFRNNPNDELEPNSPSREQGEMYWPLKGSVFPPSSFASSVDDLRIPSERLQLEHVYGFRAWDTRYNVRFLNSKNLLYNAAGVAILHNRDSNVQQYFCGHNDDVVCVAVHPTRPIIASGQSCSLKGSKKPKICVWNYNKETFIPDHSSYTVLEDFHHRCVVSLDFDVSGKYLGSIGMDDDNSVAIYDWERPEKKLVATSPGSKGKVVMIRFNPHGDGSQFVTCGVKLIRFWQMEKQTGGAFKLTSKNGVFGKYPQQTITCVEFVKGHPNLVLAGANNGEVLLWDKNTLVSSIAAHTGAVFSLIATPSCDAIFTAGKDGKIKKWQITDRARGHISTASKDIAAFGAAQVIRAIDYDDTTKTVAYGTSGGQVGTVSVADTSATTYTAVRLNQGHASELWGLAAHPTQPVFATASVDGSLVLWNAEKRVAIAERRLSTQSLQSASGEDLADESSPVTVLDVPVGAGLGAACLDFSPSGDRLAVGLFYGGIEILDANTLHSIQSMKRPQSRNNLASLSASSVAESHMDALESRGGGTPGPNNSNSNSSSQSSDGTSSPNSSSTLRVQDIKYSPSGQLLAAGLSDGSIHIYNCSSSSLKYLGSCKGHSASVTHLDWSSDSKFIQSSSAAYEYLFWDIDTMKQIRKSMKLRDAEFATHTCVLGWAVKGIWAPGSDGTDVNSVCRSHSKTLLATADDNGLVKLFRFPAYDQKMQYRIYGGHSSHVTNVKFAANDTWVFSTGGQDCSVLQWRVNTSGSNSRRSSVSVAPPLQPITAVPTTLGGGGGDATFVALRQLQGKGLLSNEVADRVERILSQPSIKELLIEALLAAPAAENDSAQKINDLLNPK